MDQRHSFNVSTDLFSGFIATFIQLVFLIILVYMFVLLLNFLRDKFINKETDTKKEDVSDLLAILNKLFFVSGFGFILANIFQFILSQGSNGTNQVLMSFRGEWDYLTFGIILIFAGMGFKSANKMIRTNRTA